MKKLLSLSVSAVLLLMTVHFRLWGFVYVGWICMLLLVFLWVWLLWGENFLWERKLAEWFEKAINNPGIAAEPEDFVVREVLRDESPLLAESLYRIYKRKAVETLWGEYNSRPGKKNEAKSRKIFETFRENVEYFDNEWMVNKELNRYPVRHLCYLRDALKKEIFHSGGSDMLLTAGEEAAMDRYNSLCREILEKVEKRIPDKYLD